MSLDRPWALALLVAPAALLWLRLRAQRPREAEASSLLVWRKVSPGDTAPARPRPPLAAWLEAAGAALLVLGVAGPAGPPAAAAGTVRVLLDTSASMRAEGPGGRTRLETVRAIVAEYATSIQVQESADPAKDLAALHAAGAPVVAVTDHRPAGFEEDPPRLHVVGLGSRGFNAGITAASGVPLPDGRWRLFLSVEAFGAQGPVEGALRIGDLEESLTVAPGKALEVVREVAAGAKEARVEFPGDAMGEDDRVALRPRGGRSVSVEVPGELRGTPLVRALEAAGAEATDGEGEAIHLLGREAGPGPPSTRFPGPRVLCPRDAPGEDVLGESVVVGSHALVRDVHVDPTAILGKRAGTLQEGETLLADSKGPLVTVVTMAAPLDYPEVRFGFLPGGTWVERDPSFVVFARNLVEHAAGGPARIEAEGILDPEETEEAAGGESFGDLRQALEEARLPDPSTRASWAPALLAAGAALLVAAWLATR